MVFTGNNNLSIPNFERVLSNIRGFPLGYVFENAAAILPHLEQPRIGVTSQFCSEWAKKLECYVMAGYPEKLDASELQEGRRESKEVDNPLPLSPNGKETGRVQVGANSAVIYGPDGKWIGGYRKTNLFETDLTWAKPGACSDKHI